MLPPTPKQIQDARLLGFTFVEIDEDDGSYLYTGCGGLTLRLTRDHTNTVIIAAQLCHQARMAERLSLMDQLSGAARLLKQSLHT